MHQIEILMACYNGGKYLVEQIDSILRQSFTDWCLLIRDDGSTDNSLEILKEYAKKEPLRVKLLQDDLGNLGPRENFKLLLSKSQAPYTAFSDQDDIWKPNKLERALSEMKAMESSDGGGASPLMVFADREIIDSDNNLLARSYWQRYGQHPKNYPELMSLITNCVAAGSTMLINSRLRELSQPIPEQARMHDTWIELVAGGIGKRKFLDEVALSYRRHDANVSGSVSAMRESRGILARAAKFVRNLDTQKKVYEIYHAQAEAFYKKFGDELNPELRSRLEVYLKISKMNLIMRTYCIIRYRLGPPGWERQLAFIMCSR